MTLADVELVTRILSELSVIVLAGAVIFRRWGPP